MPIHKNNKWIDQFELRDDDNSLLAVAIPTNKNGEYRILEELSKEARYAIILSNSLINMGKTIFQEK